MSQPTFPAITSDTLHMIAGQHNLAAHTFTPLPSIGMFNAIYLLGDELILRVPRDQPHFVAALIVDERTQWLLDSAAKWCDV